MIVYLCLLIWTCIRWRRLSHRDTTWRIFVFFKQCLLNVWNVVWSIENLAQWGNPACRDISLPVSKIILNLILSEKSHVIGLMLPLACCACVRHFVYLLRFPKIPSYLSPCLLHFHSVYKMAKAIHTYAVQVKIRTKEKLVGQGFHLCWGCIQSKSCYQNI